MKPVRRISRRSFFARVVGGAVTAGSLSLIGGTAEAYQVTDHDPTDPTGHGRGGGSGITDSDSGPGADPAGRGRGGGSRAQQGSGITDRDSGPGADPAGNGRGSGSGATQQERDESCDRLRELERQYADAMARGEMTGRNIYEHRRVVEAIAAHC